MDLLALGHGSAGVDARWPHNKTRYSFTAEALKSERVKYLTLTTGAYEPRLSDDEALANFVGRTEEIALTEVTEWRGDFLRGAGGSKQT